MSPFGQVSGGLLACERPGIKAMLQDFMNDFDASSECLAVVLSPYDGPKIVKLSAAELVAPSLRLADADYVDSGAGDWLGFYDWLRSTRGNVIGVQQWIDDAPPFPFSTKFEGVEASVNRDVLQPSIVLAV